MTFRKNHFLYYEGKIVLGFFIVMSFAAMVLLLVLSEAESLLFTIPLFLTAVVLRIVSPRSFNEFVTINETGISCHKLGKELWAYKWADILALKKFTYCGYPAAAIIVPSPCRGLDACRGIEHARASDDYFQLCRTAKEALKQFYKPADALLNNKDFIT